MRDVREQSGYPFYGQQIGILVFAGESPRICGDPGVADTFPFHVCYEIVKGSFKDLIDGCDEIKNNLITAVKNLENKGIKAIVGDCGLMALYQREILKHTTVPIILSSLSLIPFIMSFIGEGKKLGIITGHSSLLKDSHLSGAGVQDKSRLIIQGMEEESHFCDIVISGKKNLDPYKMEADVLSAASKLAGKGGDGLSAVLLECSNLATYSYSVARHVNLPVFDINSVVNFLYNSVSPSKFL